MRFCVFNILNKVIINSLALVYLMKLHSNNKTKEKKFKVYNQ